MDQVILKNYVSGFPEFILEKISYQVFYAIINYLDSFVNYQFVCEQSKKAWHKRYLKLLNISAYYDKYTYVICKF